MKALDTSSDWLKTCQESKTTMVFVGKALHEIVNQIDYMTPHAKPIKELRDMAELLISQADVLYSATLIKIDSDFHKAQQGAANVLKAALAGCFISKEEKYQQER